MTEYITGARGTGKTKKLLEFCHDKDDVILVTQNARAMRVKANSYGYNVNIIDASEVDETNLYNKKVALHDLDYFVNNCFDFQGANIVAATVRTEE